MKTNRRMRMKTWNMHGIYDQGTLKSMQMEAKEL